MQKVTGYALLALFLFVAYQSINNASTSATEVMGEGMARQAACNIDDACVLQSGPHIVKTDVFRRRYQFKTDQGNVTVTCDRQYIWLGDWSCRSVRGGI